VGPAGPGRSTEQRGSGAAVVQRVEEVGRGKEGGEDSADRWARLVSEGRVRRAGRSAGLRSGRGGRGGLLGGGVEGVRWAAVGSGPRGEGRLGPPGRGKGMRRRAGRVLVSSFFLLSFSIPYFKPI
jgi:hypothetical protein